MATNKEKIKGLKAKLAAGGLSQEQYDNITNKITNLGGKFNASNFPGVGASTPGGSGTTSDTQAQFDETVEAGKAFADSIIQDYGLEGEFLGRVDEEGSNLNEALALAKSNIGGLDAAENVAFKEAALTGMNQDFAKNQRLLASIQGQTGVRGAAAGAQSRDLLRDQMGARQGLERDLTLANINQKNLALDRFGVMAGSVDQFNRTGQLANVGLAGQELSTKLGAGLGAIGTATGIMGSIDAANFAKAAFEESLAAQKQSEQNQLKFAEKALKAQQNAFNNFGGQFGV